MRLGHYLGICMVAALACTTVQAETTAPATPAVDGLQGPLINGVCLLSRQAVFANAKVGKAATARLQQLANGAQSRFDSERGKLADDVRAFQQQAKSLPDATRRTQEAALDQRAHALEAERQRDIRQLELTRVQAMNQIGSETQPILASVYRTRGCGLLLDRNAVLGGNFGNDLTAAVVQGLDAKVTTISFNLAPLPATGGSQGAN
ncbi:OmpH/Skp family outer membrane protein [Frateuria aurantia]